MAWRRSDLYVFEEHVNIGLIATFLAFVAPFRLDFTLTRLFRRTSYTILLAWRALLYHL